MKELDFKKWLINNNYSKKVASDTCSRIKRVEKEFGYIDIDIEYENDGCSNLLLLFKNSGRNEEIRTYGLINLPTGKYHIAVYTYAIRLYLKYKKNESQQ